MDAIVRLEAAAKSIPHECRIILNVPRALRTAAAKKLAFEAGVAARVAGDHRGVEVGNPFPNEAVQIVNTP